MDSSYNRINGTAACESDPAMNQILKKELNFQGLWVVQSSGLIVNVADDPVSWYATRLRRISTLSTDHSE